MTARRRAATAWTGVEVPHESWRELALCAGWDTSLFYPGKGEGMALARSLCRLCTVSEECLEFSMQAEIDHRTDRHGMFGGLGPVQRESLQERRDRE